MSKSLRRKIALFLGIPLLIAGGAFSAYRYVRGGGTVHVVAPDDGALTVLLDGEEIVSDLPILEHTEIDVAQGAHQLELVRDDGTRQSYSVDVEDGFFEALAPAAGQCFVELDVTDSHYRTAREPTVGERYFSRALVDIAGHRYFDWHDLPTRLPRAARVYKLQQVPCDLSAASERQLLRAAGYSS